MVDWVWRDIYNLRKRGCECIYPEPQNKSAGKCLVGVEGGIFFLNNRSLITFSRHFEHCERLREAAWTKTHPELEKLLEMSVGASSCCDGVRRLPGLGGGLGAEWSAVRRQVFLTLLV